MRLVRTIAITAVTTAVSLVTAAGVAAAPAGPAGPPPHHGASDCGAVADLVIPAEAMGLPTSGGRVTGTERIPAANGAGPYCRVDAAIMPVDPEAPEIRMAVALPENWNGDAMMFGGGGYNGTIPNLAQNVPFGPVDRPTPLARGYATFGSDSGHRPQSGVAPFPSLDGSFGLNDEAVRNFSGDALKKVRDAAMLIVDTAYGTAPDRSYFAGGSTGGREALAVAQRWPRDFDGVISVYPAWNAATLDLFFGRVAHAMAAPGAFPGPEEQRLLEARVREACDGSDGLEDGVISDEAGCDFDPWVLECPDGAQPGPSCLSAAQIESVITASSPWHLPYRVASGEWGYPGFPLLSGARMSTPILGFGTDAPADPMPWTAGYGAQFWGQWARYFVARDPEAGPFDIDPQQPGPRLERISALTELQDVNDADLRPFARAGGKLLLLHGTADELVSHRSTIDYYRRVEDAVGGRLAERFMRFYLVPGANHANFEPAFAAAWDSLGALEAWVEEGTPPEDPVVTDARPAGDGRTRPLCEYPKWPAYRGSGDPEAESSFVCRR